MKQEHLDAASELGAIGLNWNDYLTPDWLARLHAQGLVGYVYTLNQPLGWLGALAMGVIAAAAFAVIGFVASTAMAARERLSEFAVLRALGLSTRQLAAWLAIENITLIVLSLVIGTGLGLLITAVVVPFVALTPSGARTRKLSISISR